MIQEKVKSLSKIITELPWIERHGGLAKIVTKTTIVQDTPYIEVYPIAEGVTGKECWEGSRYLDLCPDSQYRSVSYFEQMGNVALDKENDDIYKVTVPLRLICWLNMKRLNQENQNGHLYEIAMMRHITKRKSPNLSIRFTGSTNKSENIFQRFSYAERQDLFLYPYDWFGLNFSMSYHLNLDDPCYQEIIEQENIC